MKEPDACGVECAEAMESGSMFFLLLKQELARGKRGIGGREETNVVIAGRIGGRFMDYIYSCLYC